MKKDNNIGDTISKFISSLSKEGSKQLKIAKKEFNLMVLLEKKNTLIAELGMRVYYLSKKKENINNNAGIKKLISDIKKLDAEEERINKKKTKSTAKAGSKQGSKAVKKKPSLVKKKKIVKKTVKKSSKSKK